MRRVPLLIAGLPVLVVAVLLLADPYAATLGMLSDDAFYYLRISQSIVAGDGCTFDGIALTNGFHPLWMLCIVGISFLFDNAGLPPVVATILLGAAVCGLTLYVMYRAVERWAAPGFGAVAVATCLTPGLLAAMTNGMETGILLLAVALFVWCSYRHDLLSNSTGAGKKFGLGLLLGAIFLCRLDSAFVVIAGGTVVLAAGLAGRTALPILFGRCLAMVAGVVVLAAPFFAWNALVFGHWTPISGRVKTCFPDLRSPLTLEGDVKWGFALVAIDVLIVTALVWIDRRRGRGLASTLVSPLSVLTLGSLIHFAFAFFFMSWGVYWWHFVVYGMAMALGAAQLAARWSEAWPWARWALRVGLPVLAAAAGVLGQAWLSADRVARHREWLAAALWARDHTDPDDVFAMKDAGLFGYFSQRRVVNLDGKANGYEYLAELERGNVLGYLARAHVGYVAEISAVYFDGHAPISLPRARQPWLALSMPIEDEVYRSELYPGHRLFAHGSDSARFAIWKLDPLEPR